MIRDGWDAGVDKMGCRAMGNANGESKIDTEVTDTPNNQSLQLQPNPTTRNLAVDKNASRGRKSTPIGPQMKGQMRAFVLNKIVKL